MAGGIDDWAERRRRELERASRAVFPAQPKPRQRASQVRKVSMSPAAKRRAMSVGVSSSSRHRSRVAQRARKKR